MADPVRGARGRAKRINVGDIFSLSITLLTLGMFSEEVATALASMKLQALILVHLILLPTVNNMLAVPFKAEIGCHLAIIWFSARLLSSWLR